MATSGSIDYSRNRNQIIQEALEIIGIVGAGETPSSEDISTASTTLNLLTKSWQAQGRHLWSMQEAVILLTAGTSSYNLPGAYGSNTVVKTELSAAGATNDTTLTVDSTTGMTAADVIGIELDDGTMKWTTIVSVDSTTALTITAGLTSAAAIDNHVYTYTTAIARPLRILDARVRDSNNNDLQLAKYTKDEYYAIPDKSAAGSPIGYYYDPQLTTGVLYLWPTPDDVQDRLHITYERSIQDFDNSTDDPDFPQEWLMALAWNLALNIAPKFSIDRFFIKDILAPMAALHLEQALVWDNEIGSIYFSLDEE